MQPSLNPVFKQILNAHIAKTLADQAIQKAMSSQTEPQKEQK